MCTDSKAQAPDAINHRLRSVSVPENEYERQESLNLDHQNDAVRVPFLKTEFKPLYFLIPFQSRKREQKKRLSLFIWLPYGCAVR